MIQDLLPGNSELSYQIEMTGDNFRPMMMIILIRLLMNDYRLCSGRPGIPFTGGAGGII